VRNLSFLIELEALFLFPNVAIINTVKMSNNTKSGSKVSSYLRESYDELLHKVSWPTWSELQQSTAIVLIATVLLTAIVWVMDLASSSVLKFIYQLFK